MDWPDSLAVNAWIGDQEAATSPVSPTTMGWALNENIPKEFAPDLAPEPEPDLRDWRSPRVGWGLILPYRKGLSDKKLATAADAPAPIRKLCEARNNPPIFRYQKDSPNSITQIKNYGSGENIPLSSAGIGTAGDELPFYLLIYATPEEIPWELQYNLNANRAVGRLDLKGKRLENYVNALIGEWEDASSRVDRPVVWAVDHGHPDITQLMRDSIAKEIYTCLLSDSDIGDKAKFIDGAASGATGPALIKALAEMKPALVVTTSHGQNHPLSDLKQMGRNLGLPIDQNHQSVKPAALLSKWEPDGAIWYSHACSSAGSNSSTIFDGVVPADSPIDKMLKAVAKLGAKTAPLPTALLGAKKPLRAFIGHVEPTFNWTLRQPKTSETLTVPIRRALYNKLLQPEPLGLAFRACYERLGSLYVQYDQSHRDLNKGKQTQDILLFCQLAARDIQSTVILGDPTVALPPLP